MGDEPKLLTSLIEHSEEKIELAKSLYESCVRKRNKVKSNFRLILSSYFSRPLEIFETILLLVQNDRITDAGVLLRSFSNLIINLGYIMKKQEERATMLLYDMATQHRKLYEKGKNFYQSIGKWHITERYYNFYKNQEKKYEKIIQRDYPNAKPWDKVKIYEKAKTYHELQLVYDLVDADLSRYEHHDFSSMRDYVDTTTCNPILKTKGKRHSPVLYHERILMLANIIFGMVMEFFNGEYQLNWKNKIDEMTQGFMALTGVSPS